MRSLFGRASSEAKGRAVAQVVSRWLPTSASRVRVRRGMWDLWRTKRYCFRFSPSTLVSPANYHSSNLSIIIIILGGHNRPIGGRSAVWTQLDSTPHYTNQKNLVSTLTITIHTAVHASLLGRNLCSNATYISPCITTQLINTLKTRTLSMESVFIH
jgi:hypothetical protein